ncbi:MAG: hypothetical protein WCH61_05720, partial [bacterium]
RGLVADVIRQEWTGELRLVDLDPVALAAAERLAAKMLAQRGHGRVTLRASLDRRELLPGATVVVCTIGVGGRRAWEQDVLIPRRHGVFQPVGDSVMPGGASRALRMIPAMVAIARDVQELAPAALFFNYGNPMSATCRAVRLATGADMIGLCHGVNHCAGLLAGLLDVPATEFCYNALGVNHLTWFTEAGRVGGGSLMPRLREIAAARCAAADPRFAGTFLTPDGSWPAGDVPAGAADPLSWELTAELGAFPAPQDRHITEFFPHLYSREGAYYGKTLGVDAFSFEGTIALGDQEFARLRDVAQTAAPLPEEFFNSICGEHEQVTDIVDAIRSGTPRVFSANLPNCGQIPNLPADAVVESPAVTVNGTLKPLPQAPLPALLAATLASRLHWIELVVEAALECDQAKFAQALFLDGCLASPAAARRLAGDLLAAQQPFLPEWRLP